MIPHNLLLFTLTFYQVIITLDAFVCPKGKRVVFNHGTYDCVDCQSGTYQPEENNSMQCKACTVCEEDTGSEVKQECTKEMDRKCQCRGLFVPRDTDSSTCMCDRRFGLNKGECLKCEDGYLSTSINSPCQKRKDSTIDQPHGGLDTEIHTTATTSAPRHSTIQNNEVLHDPSSTDNHIGMILLFFGVVGLLALIAVTCKLHTTPHMETQGAVQKNDSACGRPVEESGDGSLSPLKVYQEEP
ncbi:uncharacterized protein si:ch73-361p23.3 [Antennarius striatus]|uniref:uncharacterized protein si:ch73-361p23.3 n=1 Tax=Antennarius striatus TaxID=241820 RepID=UPI0035AF9088